MSVYATIDVIDAAFEDVPAVLRDVADGDGLYVGALLSARMVRSDYGVSGSPVWYDAEDIDVESFEINGVDMMPKEVAAKFGKEVADFLLEAAIERGEKVENWDE